MKSPGAIARNGVRDRLADPSLGWNALMPAIAEEYGVRPDDVRLNFSGQSRNVERSLRNVEDFELTRMVGPLMLSLGVQESQEGGGATMRMFSGFTTVVLQFLYEQRVADAVPDFDALVEISESVADAVEDCCLQVLNKPDVMYPAMTPTRSFQCLRGTTEALPDGIRKGILVQINFGVDL